MKRYSVLIYSLLLVACNNVQDSNTVRESVDSSARSSQKPGQVVKRFEQLKIDRATFPVTDSIKGKIVDAASWQDAEGAHVVALSETPNEMKNETQNKTIYAACYVNDGSGWKQQWLVQDHIDQCEVDATCEFFPASLTITDSDSNNIGEATFLYKLSCKGDVSPDEKKLIMYEGDKKYAIRGTTVLQIAGGKEGGDKKIDPAFNNASRGLLDFANRRWESFGKQKL